MAAIVIAGLASRGAHAQTYDVVPKAGGLSIGAGTASTLQLHFVDGVAVAPDGSLIVPGYYSAAVWRVQASGAASVIAGNPDLPDAQMRIAADAVVAPNGDVFVSDFGNFVIRRIDHATGAVSVFAGTGVEPYSVDGPGGDPSDDITPGAATAVAMMPLAMAIGAGGLYYADQDIAQIRRIDLTTGAVSIVAGTDVETYSIDGPGGDPSDDFVENVPATQASISINYGGGMAVAADGTVYFCDTNLHVVEKIDPTTHVMTRFAGTSDEAFGGDGGPATAAMLDTPFDVAIGAGGVVYIADQVNNRIRQVAANGTITTIAGNGDFAESADGGAATASGLMFPRGLLVLPTGELLFADSFSHRVRKIDAQGVLTTVVGRTIGDGAAATDAMLNQPAGIRFASDGSLLVADTNDYRIRRIAADGTITTIAGSGFPFLAGDNGPALEAGIRFALDVTTDASGTVYFTDLRNGRVRAIDTTGTIRTVVTGLRAPKGIAVLPSGDLVVAESANHRIDRIDHTTFAVTTLVDTMTAAPQFVAIDSSGDVVFTTDAHVVQRFAGGTVTTLAGTGTEGFSGDGGPATAAQLSNPFALAYAPDGALWFVDAGNARVRRIATDGTITTVAGTGDFGLTPAAGGPAATTSLAGQFGLAIAPDGTAYVVTDHRIFAIVPHVEPPQVDAGMQPDAGGTTPTPPAADAGCGCHTSGGGAGAMVVVVVAGLVVRRRHRPCDRSHAA